MHDKDINHKAIHYLVQAYLLSQNKPHYFLCFGQHTHYLVKYELIDDENNVTNVGRHFAKYYLSKGYYSVD